MIEELFYVIKIGMFTLLMIFMMQLEIGDKTLETHSYKIITEASRTLKLNQTAHGLIIAIKEGQKMAQNTIQGWLHKNNNQNTEAK